MKELEFLLFKTRDEFRQWLKNHHDESPGIWMVYYKKHIHEQCIRYDEALDEALCFGWIDSLIKKLDIDRYARKFTPRTDIRKWSDLNRRKAIGLVRDGRMTQAGLDKMNESLLKKISDPGNVTPEKKTGRAIMIPDFITIELGKNQPALENFNNLPQTYRKHYILWITSAKRDETIQKRLSESIVLLKENRKLGLK